jgi:hypothetical protein
LWAGQQVYDPTTLGDFLYLPLTLLIYVPFTWLDRVTAAALVLAIDAAFFTWACAMLTVALVGRDRRIIDAIALPGDGARSSRATGRRQAMTAKNRGAQQPPDLTPSGLL